ncbi:MAG: YggT family protein [Leptolyngbyaceae cyanobacterium bins.59]|nr:YggT family protein [Leptolyngbyaceae cyanobacterium bins.59]
MNPALDLLISTLSRFLSIYIVLLVIRILLSWFPVDWYSAPFSILGQLTDPYLNLFRRIIPPLGGLDFSPILAILVLQLIQQAVLPVANSLVSAALSSIG